MDVKQRITLEEVEKHQWMMGPRGRSNSPQAVRTGHGERIPLPEKYEEKKQTQSQESSESSSYATSSEETSGSALAGVSSSSSSPSRVRRHDQNSDNNPRPTKRGRFTL